MSTEYRKRVKKQGIGCPFTLEFDEIYHGGKLVGVELTKWTRKNLEQHNIEQLKLQRNNEGL